MRRYWVDPEDFKQDVVYIRGSSHRHICQVCRRTVGHRFEVFSDQEKIFLVELIRVESQQAQARILSSYKNPALLSPPIHLALSLPKWPTLEKVIQKSVELGVHGLHLFSSDYSFMKRGQVFGKNPERWKKILRGAMEQTGRCQEMVLSDVQPLENLLQCWVNAPEESLGILAYEGDGGQNLEDILIPSISSYSSLWLFVGSEGGFSMKDLDLFHSFGVQSTSLGPQVLRVETACVAFLSILKYSLGHLRSLGSQSPGKEEAL